MQILPQSPRQGSSAMVKCWFKDSENNGAAVTPESVTWSLMTLDGTIINSREDVVIAPASYLEIWLSGDDLAILDETNPYELRKILVEAVYDNGAEDVPLKDEGQFSVENIGV